MIFKKFKIQGYRAIDDAEVEFSKNQIIPVIGVNESGKTSILQAILAFDKSKDKTNNGTHLDYKNKYNLGKAECKITAHIQLEELEEVDELMKRLKVDREKGFEIEGILKGLLESSRPFSITRRLIDKTYSVDGIDLDEAVEKRFIRHVLESLPFILYFDDFSDRVPEKIEFPKDYAGEKSIKGRSMIAEWQKLLEEIVKRSTNGGYALIDLFNMAIDEDDQQGLLADINDTLNKEIVEDWKQLKKKGLSFSEESIDLELKLEMTPWDDGSHSFKFKVVDKSNDGRRRQFNVVERSKGFQWFFNFTLKLKFNAKYKSNPSGAIYLLDEPGSYLHASAQDELLKALKDISKTNVILYCTHSQHLLNPTVINVSSIRIATKHGASVGVVPFGEYRGKKKEGALTPLYDALRMKIPLSSIERERIIVTEGVTDFYMLMMLSMHTELIDLSKISVIPGAGADQLKELISLVISSTDRFVVLFDNDKAGKGAASTYSKYFGEEVACHFLFYGEGDGFTLESHFSHDDNRRLKEITGASNVKAGIVQLYFLPDEIQSDYFSGISKEFLNRFAKTKKSIDALATCVSRRNLMTLLSD